MTEYYNIEEINCKKSNDKWQCSITRRLSEKTQKINENICFATKTESIDDIEHVELQEGTNQKCIIMEGYKGKTLRCEAIK